MLRLRAGGSVARHLVALQAGCLQKTARRLHHGGLVVFAGAFPLPRRDAGSKRRALLHGQGVDAHMARTQLDGPLHAAAPAAHALAGASADEVDAPAELTLLDRLHGTLDVCRAVRAAVRAQDLVVEALRPDAHAAHTQGVEVLHQGGVDAFWVGLDSELGHLFQVDGKRHEVDERVEAAAAQMRGRSPTYIYGAHATQQPRARCTAQLQAEGVCVGVHDGVVVAGRRGKVAVRAAARAEGNVQVEGADHRARSSQCRAACSSTAPNSAAVDARPRARRRSAAPAWPCT